MTQEEMDAIKRRFSKPEAPSGPPAAGAPAARPAAALPRAAVSTGYDVGKSIERGVDKGVVGSPGVFADMVRLGQLARDYTRSTNIGGPSQGTFDDIRKRRDAEREANESYVYKPSTLQKYGSQAFIDQADELSGGNLNYKPATKAGRVVMPIAEMTGGAAAGGIAGGGRGFVGNVIRQGVLPGAAIEGAKAAGVENPVALGAIGLGTGAAATAATTQSAAKALGSRASGATEAQIQAAERLFQFAQNQNPPLPLSRASALDMVTGGRTSASDIQRVVENQKDPAMREFYADSPERIQAAGGRALDTVGPVSEQPSTIGPRVKEQMETRIEGTEQAINEHTRPAYQQFEREPLTSDEFARLLQDPLFMLQHQAVLQDPELNYLTQTMRPDSVEAVDLTRRILRERQEALRDPASENRSPTRAGGYGASGGAAEEVSNEASRRVLMTGQGEPSPREAVQEAQARAREALVDPLVQGPEGKAMRAGTTEGAREAAFPQKPNEGAHHEVRRMVQSLAEQDPNLAREFVRNYLGTAFAKTQNRGQGGENYYQAPAFYAEVMGNPEARASITAALEALPGGAGRAEAFHDIMRVFQAMGKREKPGSMTAPTQETLAQMKEAGISEGAFKVLSSAGTAWPAMVKDKFQGWRLGRNTEEIASLLTDPARAADFAAIARSAPGSAHRMALVTRLIASGASARDAALNNRAQFRAAVPGTAIVRGEDDRDRRKELER